MKYIPLMILCLLTATGCTSSLEEELPSMDETINGFHVKWRSSTSQVQRDAARQIIADMVKVEGGYFMLGATPEQEKFARQNEYPTVPVNITDYYICSHEISDQQYELVMGEQLTYFSYTDWLVFLSHLSDMTGLLFDIPTEAQWEFAARGGNASLGYVYPGSSALEDVWNGSEFMGSQRSNELGLYNMADLKSEWCSDEYIPHPIRPDYDNGLLAESGKKKVVRGGNFRCSGHAESYQTPTKLDFKDQFGYFHSGSNIIDPYYDKRYCRITARSYYYSTIGTSNIGCRPVINISSPKE